MEIDLTKTFAARADRYCAGKIGAFILPDAFAVVPHWDLPETFARISGRFMRILYVCRDGVVRDIVGRQGVYQSAQDGVVTGEGHAMRIEGRTVGLWTYVGDGEAVNRGTGKGYRTLRIEGVLAIKVGEGTILTDVGAQLLRQVGKPKPKEIRRRK